MRQFTVTGTERQEALTPTLPPLSLEGRAAVPWEREARSPRGARGHHHDDSAADPADPTQGAEATGGASSEQALPKDPRDRKRATGLTDSRPGRFTERRRQWVLEMDGAYESNAQR